MLGLRKGIKNPAAWLLSTHRDYRAVFRSVEGQRVLADMLDRTSLETLQDLPADPTQVWGLMQRRQVVLEIAGFAGLSETDLRRKIAAMKEENGYAEQEDDGEDEDPS